VRDEFAAEFSDRLVSPVMRSKTGAREWTFCAECPSNRRSQNADLRKVVPLRSPWPDISGSANGLRAIPGTQLAAHDLPFSAALQPSLAMPIIQIPNDHDQDATDKDHREAGEQTREGWGEKSHHAARLLTNTIRLVHSIRARAKGSGDRRGVAS
jgi:hypothetical protein